MMISSRQRHALFAGLVGATLTLATATLAQETRIVAGDYGTSVEVPANPQRVAVLHPAFVEMYLDLGGKPIAVSSLSDGELAELPADQQAAHAAATNVALAAGEIDLEKLAALEPDVILTLTGQEEWDQLKDKFNAIAPTVPVDIRSASDFQFTALAEATNTVETLRQQEAAFAAKVAEIQTAHAEVVKSARIVEVDRWNGQDPGMFNINASMCAEVVLDAGIIPDFAPSEYSLSYEQMSQLADYDLILYNVGLDGEPTVESAAFMAQNVWQALPAVQSGHAQPTYCGTWKTYGFVMQYLDGLEKALATLSKTE